MVSSRTAASPDSLLTTASPTNRRTITERIAPIFAGGFAWGSGDRHHQPPAGLTLEDAGAGVEHLREWNAPGHGRELVAVEIEREAPPGFEPARRRAMDAVDPEERDAAQDEGRDRRGQVHAPREPARRDRAAVARLRERVGERGRADAVDRGRPSLLAERLAGSG